MSVTLAYNSYGKSQVRLLKLVRYPDRHDVRELTVALHFEGDYDAVHLAGDNRHVLPTDTMKNTVYALAKLRPIEHVEGFGLALADHFFADTPHVTRIRIELVEHVWERLTSAGWPHHHAFARGSEEKRTTAITATRENRIVESGLRDLLVLKTSGSAFSGYLRDRYTTLRETEDRLFATRIDASWRYSDDDVAFDVCRAAARRALLEAFADHESRSVQHTLYAMGAAVLEHVPEIVDVRLSLPNKHHLVVDLAPFGLANDNEIFLPTDEPFGLIEGTVTRTGATAPHKLELL